MTEPEKSLDLGEILTVTVRLGVGQLPTDCSMRISVICSAVTQKPKVQNQLSYNIMLGQKNLKVFKVEKFTAVKIVM